VTRFAPENTPETHARNTCIGRQPRRQLHDPNHLQVTRFADRLPEQPAFTSLPCHAVLYARLSPAVFSKRNLLDRASFCLMESVIRDDLVEAGPDSCCHD